MYHIINRTNGRVQIFHTDKDYQHLESLMREAKDLTGMRILAYCIMPNHFHFVLYTRTDHDLGAFMGRLTTTACSSVPHFPSQNEEPDLSTYLRMPHREFRNAIL